MQKVLDTLIINVIQLQSSVISNTNSKFCKSWQKQCYYSVPRVFQVKYTIIIKEDNVTLE